MAKSSAFPKATEYYERQDPLRNLWRNVLIVALEDALGKGINGGALNANYRAVSKDRALDYFLEPNRDFVLVCQLAGFDHEYVRMKVRKKFKCLQAERNLNA